MTSAELRAICDRLGIPPGRFAELAGARPGTRPGWIRPDSDQPVPPAVATLARIAKGVAGRMPYADLARLLEAEAAKLRAAGTGR